MNQQILEQYDELWDQKCGIADGVTATFSIQPEREEIKQFLLAALNQKDAEWREKIEGLRMEERPMSEHLSTATEIVQEDRDENYNKAIREINTKIDQILQGE